MSERQAHKLISITSELIAPLKDMLYADVIDINTAAALAQLPSDYQEYAIEIIKSASDKESEKYAIEHAMEFARRAKNIISKTNTLLTKEKTSRLYYNGRLSQAKEELSRITKEIESPDVTDNQLGELTTKKLEAEKTLASTSYIPKEYSFKDEKINS